MRKNKKLNKTTNGSAVNFTGWNSVCLTHNLFLKCHRCNNLDLVMYYRKPKNENYEMDFACAKCLKDSIHETSNPQS